MTKVNSVNQNETKSDFFFGTYSNLTSFFIRRKILKCFNKHKQVKRNKSDSVFTYLQGSALSK